MKNLKRLTSLLIVLFVFFGSLFSFNELTFGEVVNQKIAGYGPLQGDLLLSSSAKFDDKYIYIMDSFGISMFDRESGDFVKEIKVNTGQSEFYSQIFEVNSFFQLIKAMEDTAVLMNLLSSLLDKVNYIPTIDFALDSKGLIYFLDFDGISIYNPKNNELLDKIDLNLTEENHKEKSIKFVSFKIYEDSIYILVFSLPFGNEIKGGRAELLKYDISKKEVISKIELMISEDEDFTIIPFDFAISQDRIIALIGLQLDIDSLLPTIGIYTFNESGKLLCSYPGNNEETPSFMPNSIDFQNNTILTTGLISGMMGMPTERTSIIKLELVSSEESNYEIKEAGRIEDEDFGLTGMDVYVKGEELALLTSGKMSNILAYSAFLISDDEIKQYGKFVDSEGQIYGSISYAISDEEDLYETNLLSPYIDVFSKDGEFKKRIEIDTSIVSSMMGVLTLPPIILDMEINGDNLYVYNFFPTNISAYSIENNEWSTLWSDEMMSSGVLDTFPIDMRIKDDKIYLLGAVGENPKISIFSQAGEIEEEELILTEGQYKTELPPLWAGFCITNEEYQILDGFNRSILIFDSDSKELKNIVNLSKELAIYTSIDIHPDSGWIVSDVSRNKIVHYGNDGKFIESIGESGFVTKKLDKETYQKDPDKFFGLTRAKIKNNKIYANDLLNFRYHIITIKAEEETLPEIKFDPSEINLENFSLRENKDLTIKFIVNQLETDFSLELETNVDWIELKKTSISLSEGEFNFTIIGDNLEGWKENSGTITITSINYPDFKKEIPVKVTTHGIIIELTIDEKEAFVITKLGELKIYELDVPPMIKDSRTFVPLRFFGDAIGAKVDWNNEERKVVYTKKDKEIVLFIDKKIAYVNGEEKELDAAPFIKDGRTLVPVRFVSENLDSSVEWNSQERTVRITYPKK